MLGRSVHPILIDFMWHEKGALKGGDRLPVSPVFDGDADVVQILKIMMLWMFMMRHRMSTSYTKHFMVVHSKQEGPIDYRYMQTEYEWEVQGSGNVSCHIAAPLAVRPRCCNTFR